MRGSAKRDGLRGDCYKIRIVFNRQRDSFEKFPPFFRHKKGSPPDFHPRGLPMRNASGFLLLFAENCSENQAHKRTAIKHLVAAVSHTSRNHATERVNNQYSTRYCIAKPWCLAYGMYFQSTIFHLNNGFIGI